MADYVHRKKDGKLYKCIGAVVDIGLVDLGFYLAFLLASSMNLHSENIESFIKILPYMSIIVAFFFYIYSVFYILRYSLIENIYSILLSIAMIDITTSIITFLYIGIEFPLNVFVLAYFVQVILLLVWKLTVRTIIKNMCKAKRILVVGPQEETNVISKKILLERKKYIVDVKHICNVVDKSICKLINDVDEVAICPNLDSKAKTKIVNYCIGIGKIVYIVPDMFEITLTKSRMEQFDDIPVFKLDNIYLSLEKRVIKRLMDIFISFIGVIIVSPILLIVSVCIKLYDDGPVLFHQKRVTREDRIFTLYKFRTMIVDAEKYTGPVLAAEKDPRITPIGKILRATRIDELPQLFNVLRGEMSIVGPRPERPHFTKQFEKTIHGFKYRTSVKAGITGLAQVLGKYTTTPEDKLRYDLIYIKNCSIMLDIKIIFQTIKVILMKESSKGVKDKTLNNPNYAIYKEIGVSETET